MPRPAHILTTFSGIFGAEGSAYEEWSFGLRSTGSVAAGAHSAAAIAASGAYRDNIVGIMPANVALTKVRVASVGTDGKVATTAGGAYLQADYVLTRAGSGPEINMPTHVACVASLKTVRADATGKGRIFLPWPAFTPGMDRLLSESNAATVAAAVKGLLQQLNGISGFGVVAVMSSKGYASNVTAVRVGRVPDTQRSRRNRRPEGYAESALTF
jgi:hypothetical protein